MAGCRSTSRQVACQPLISPIASLFACFCSPDGQTLVFLSAQASVDSGTHLGTNSLHSLKWPGDVSPPAPVGAGRGAKSVAVQEGVPALDVPIQTIIEVALRPEVDAGFPGLYSDTISRQPWLADGKTLLLTTIWRSTQAIIAVNTESGRLSRLTPEGPISWKLLDVLGNAVVAGASTPACPTKLMLGRMNAGFFKQVCQGSTVIGTDRGRTAIRLEHTARNPMQLGSWV